MADWRWGNRLGGEHIRQQGKHEETFECQQEQWACSTEATDNMAETTLESYCCTAVWWGAQTARRFKAAGEQILLVPCGRVRGGEERTEAAQGAKKLLWTMTGRFKTVLETPGMTSRAGDNVVTLQIQCPNQKPKKPQQRVIITCSLILEFLWIPSSKVVTHKPLKA